MTFPSADNAISTFIPLVEIIADLFKSLVWPVTIILIINIYLVNEKEKRVIRALIDETQGRGLYSYRKSDYYREGLASLSYKGLIQLKDNKYFLTNIGQAVAKEYIHQLFNSESN